MSIWITWGCISRGWISSYVMRRVRRLSYEWDILRYFRRYWSQFRKPSGAEWRWSIETTVRRFSLTNLVYYFTATIDKNSNGDLLDTALLPEFVKKLRKQLITGALGFFWRIEPLFAWIPMGFLSILSARGGGEEGEAVSEVSLKGRGRK